MSEQNTNNQELTSEQISRQDEVDTEIYNLVNGLVPASCWNAAGGNQNAVSASGRQSLEWNVEWMSRVREAVQSVIEDAFEITESQRSSFEMEFYPFIGLSEAAAEMPLSQGEKIMPVINDDETRGGESAEQPDGALPSLTEMFAEFRRAPLQMLLEFAAIVSVLILTLVGLLLVSG